MKLTPTPRLLKFCISHVLLLFFSVVLSSCGEKQNEQQPIDSSMKVIEAKGIEIAVASRNLPRIVQLDTMPKSQIIEVPTKAGGSYILEGTKKGEKVELMPTEAKPAGILYSFQNYTTDQGLPMDSVYCGTMDKMGNLWFGTNGRGASKYDGKSFTNYNSTQDLVLNIVYSILADKAGNIWFGTDQGIRQYDGKSFTSYTSSEGLINNEIRSIFQDKGGNLWFGTTGGGVSKYDGKSFISYSTKEGLANNDVRSISEDKEGNLWFGTNGGGVSKYDGKSFTTYTTKQGLANDHVYSILEDKEGNLWFGTNGGGVSKYDGKSFTNYTTAQGLASNSITSNLQDKNGDLWFGTRDGGVSQYNGQNFTNYTQKEGLLNNIVNSILEDKGGKLWFGIENGGLSRYDGSAFTFYTAAQGLSDYLIRSILEDKSKNLWFGTDGGGVTKYDGKTFINYSTSQGLVGNIVRGSLEDKSGNLWFGTVEGGVSKYDGKSFTNYTDQQGLAGIDVRAICEDKDGNLWFGTNGGGASKFDGSSFTNYTTDQGLASNRIKTIFEDKGGNLWFGTIDGGLSKYDGKIFTNYTTEQGLGNNYIMSILEDREKNIWIGTFGGGLIRYDGKSFLTYSTTQGLSDNAVYSAIITKEQNLAIGTNEGLSILTGFTSKGPLLSYDSISLQKNSEVVKIPPQNHLTNEELRNYTPIFEIYNVKTGYRLKDFNGGQNSMFLDSQGMIWFGIGSNKIGLVRLDYSALYKNKEIPFLVIQNVKINNENIIWYDLISNKTKAQTSKTKSDEIVTPPNLTEEAILFGRVLNDAQREVMHQKFDDIKFDGIMKFYYVPENLELPHNHNNITLDFVAIEPDYPEDVLYQYMLEGYDKDWSPPAHIRRANFGNIFEGTYKFMVKAKSTHSAWSDPISYTFKVLPPWFRTWWAYSLYIISSLAFLFAIYLWRTRALRERQKQLEFLYESAERFVPKPFLNLLNRDHIQDVKLGDSIEIKLTVLFSDIRGFTTLSEKLGPQRTSLLINTYLGCMAPIVRKFDGFVGHFLGDGILALFPGTSDEAIKAALEMQEALSLFNVEIQTKDFLPIEVGIGLNYGKAMLSILGEAKRLDANVLSDAVNAASRIENLNKLYKTKLLISNSVYEELNDPNQYLIRRIDKVYLKGKTQAIDIFEVSALPTEDKLVNELNYIKLFSQAFAEYEKGGFAKAEAIFSHCLKQNPTDSVAVILMERCIIFQKTGIPSGWDGTFTFLEK